MLKPIEALATHANMTGKSISWFERRKEALEHALSHPFDDMAREDGSVGLVIGSIYAHGTMATRSYYDPSDGHGVPPVVEYWDHEQMAWVRSPDYRPGEENAQVFARHASGPVPTAAALRERWSGIDKAESEASFFDTRAKLAAFWYDMQVAQWGPDGNPHGHLAFVADTLFKYGGRIHKDLDAKVQSKVLDTLSNLQLAWREIRMTPESAGIAMRVCATKDILQLGSQPDDADAVAVKRGTEGTIMHVRGDGHSLDVRWDKTSDPEGAREFGIYPIDTADAALVSTCFTTSPRYLVSVKYAKTEINDPSGKRTFGTDVDHVWMTGDELASTARKFGIDAASYPSPAYAEHLWWVSSTPRQDATHETSFQLDIHEVTTGLATVREPTAEDFQNIADVLGVAFEEPMELPPQREPIYGYYVNVNERGSYYADVRDPSGKTIFEVRAGESLPEGETSIFDEIDMGAGDYLPPLESYLRTLDIIPANGRLLSMSKFEAELERQHDDELKRRQAERDRSVLPREQGLDG